MKNLAVWKYPLGIPTAEVSMQRGAEILSVGVQNAEITIWALVEPDMIKVQRDIFVAGTGHVFNEKSLDKMEFIGTVFLDSFVFHIFDGGEVS